MKFSVRQILASVAGAVLAALIASVFGVKGTIVGVAIGSAAATIGTALVAQSIERGHEAVRQAVVRTSDTQSNPLLRRLGATAASTGPDAPDQSSGSDTVSTTSGDPGTSPIEGPVVPAGESERRKEVDPDTASPGPARRGAGATPTQRRFTWKALAGTAGVVFAAALLFITAVELMAGKPLSSIFGGAGTGTTVGNLGGSPASTTSTSTTTTTTSTSTPTSTSTTTGTSTTTTSTTVAGGSTTSAPKGTSTTTTSTTGVQGTTTTTLPSSGQF